MVVILSAAMVNAAKFSFILGRWESIVGELGKFDCFEKEKKKLKVRKCYQNASFLGFLLCHTNYTKKILHVSFS